MSAACAHTEFECDCDCDCPIQHVPTSECHWPDCYCDCNPDCRGCEELQRFAVLRPPTAGKDET